MLDVNTLPKVIEKLKNLTSIEMFSVEIAIEKEQKKLKNVFKTNALVPKKAVLRKEEGATVAATPYLLLSKQCGQSHGRAGRAIHRDFSKPLGETH